MNTNTLVVSSSVAGLDSGSDESDLRSPVSVVRSALGRIMNSKKQDLPSPIVSINRPSSHSPLGRRRVKFVVTLENGNQIALQVLNSHRTMQRFYGWAKKCRSLVFAIFVPEIVAAKDDNIEPFIMNVVQKIKETVRLAVNIFKRKVNEITHHYRVRGNKVTVKEVSEYFNRPKNSFYRVHTPSMSH